MPMKTGTRRREPKPIGDSTIPEGFGYWGEKFLEWLAVHNQSDKTVVTRRLQVRLFAEWCSERSLTKPSDITRPILERYQRHLFYYRRPDSRPLSFRTQHSMLQGLKAFFRWLARRNVIVANPAADLDMPRLPVRLPPPVLTHDEVERVMAQPDVSSVIGIRDRAIIEVLYSTAMRRSELAALKVFDVDPARHVVYVRQGKGKKDRVVPIGTRALGWIARYRDEARPHLAIEPDDGTLFLSTTGEALSPETLTHYVRAYVVAADLGKVGACHLLRHTVATLMLEAGADVRFVQELLGHADISTTQVYTRVSIRALQAVHAATHPGATSEDRGKSASPGQDDDDAKALLDALADEEPDG